MGMWRMRARHKLTKTHAYHKHSTRCEYRTTYRSRTSGRTTARTSGGTADATTALERGGTTGEAGAVGGVCLGTSTVILLSATAGRSAGLAVKDTRESLEEDNSPSASSPVCV